MMVLICYSWQKKTLQIQIPAEKGEKLTFFQPGEWFPRIEGRSYNLEERVNDMPVKNP